MTSLPQYLSTPRAIVPFQQKFWNFFGILTLTGALSACAVMPERPNTEISHRIDMSNTDITVGDIKLNGPLLNAFYARHRFAPVWTDKQKQVAQLSEAIAHAGEQGLDPQLFHSNELKHLSTLSEYDRDLVLSDAFLGYADALARGAFPVERRKNYLTLTPAKIDIPAALDDIIASDDPAAAITTLAPQTQTYRALQQALKSCRRSGGADCLRRISVNMERERWLPRVLPSERVWVNVAAEQLTYFRDNKPAFTTRVIVGEDKEQNQSPELITMMDGSWVNPPWVIPRDIAAKEIQPKIDRDPNYLKRNKMVALSNGEIEQLPGPEAGLGQIMFNMPNKFDVYLHDTPDRTLFKRDNRRMSHGCIRVQYPLEFASWLMHEPVSAINQDIAPGVTRKVNLPRPLTVFIIYMTAYLDPAGQVKYTADFYNRDNSIWRAIQPRTTATRAHHTPHHAKQSSPSRKRHK